MTATTATAGFCGWSKLPDQRRWTLVATCATASEALDAARAYADRLGARHRDVQVLPGDMNPNGRRHARR